MIDLAHCMTVKSAELKAHKRHALEVSTPETTYLMFADSEKEKDDWIGAAPRSPRLCTPPPPTPTPHPTTTTTTTTAPPPSSHAMRAALGAIGRAIVRCSSTYTNDDGAEDGNNSD
jgi:hypothetical protein